LLRAPLQPLSLAKAGARGARHHSRAVQAVLGGAIHLAASVSRRSRLEQPGRRSCYAGRPMAAGATGSELQVAASSWEAVRAGDNDSRNSEHRCCTATRGLEGGGGERPGDGVERPGGGSERPGGGNEWPGAAREGGKSGSERAGGGASSWEGGGGGEMRAARMYQRIRNGVGRRNRGGPHHICGYRQERVARSGPGGWERPILRLI
jgi:hypothetical protein